MKAPKHPRARRRRAPIKLTPKELAGAREDAIRWRAELRARKEIATPAPVAAAEEATAPRDADAERARFAAAITRAEFGRFYFRGESGKAAKAGGPRRNGKAPGRAEGS